MTALLAPEVKFKVKIPPPHCCCVPGRQLKPGNIAMAVSWSQPSDMSEFKREDNDTERRKCLVRVEREWIGEESGNQDRKLRS